MTNKGGRAQHSRECDLPHNINLMLARCQVGSSGMAERGGPRQPSYPSGPRPRPPEGRVHRMGRDKAGEEHKAAQHRADLRSKLEQRFDLGASPNFGQDGPRQGQSLPEIPIRADIGPLFLNIIRKLGRPVAQLCSICSRSTCRATSGATIGLVGVQVWGSFQVMLCTPL